MVRRGVMNRKGKMSLRMGLVLVVRKDWSLLGRIDLSVIASRRVGSGCVVGGVVVDEVLSLK